MAFRVESGAEPIPGYRLIERLGGGGFGEVWKAEAPGGLFKAIKFVYGDLQGVGEDVCRAEQELKGLSRVKSVHHPYILSLERYDIIDGQLMIVMELADRTLWDRFRECRTQGLPGIPRVELLDYMREAAEALDLMNSEYQLQHLDIKPQNLFLIYNHIKVADFGLVKDLEGMAGASVTGGVTPVYAAPETFDGRISRFSDQYSLAIVYQELLTATRPFAGSTMRQLVLQHLQGVPDLTAVPMSDRPVLMKALAKDPEDRYPTCIELIKELQDVRIPSAAGSPSAVAAKEKPAEKIIAEDDLLETKGMRQAAKDREEAAEALSDLAARTPRAVSDSAPLSTAPADKVAVAEKLRRNAQNANKDEANPGVLQPALVIGLGQLGIDTLRQLRKQLSDEFGHADALPHLRMIALDTDPEALQAAGQSEPSLRPSEILNTKLYRPSHYLKGRDGKTVYDGWLNPRMIYRIARQPTQAGARSLGRLAFVDNYRAIYRRLEAELQVCCSDDTLHETSQHSDLGLRTRVPRVYVVTSLGGTTGSGMFLDVAYLVRQLLRRQSCGAGEVVGLFYLPPVGNDPVRSRAMANTYAALTELQYFSSGEAVFSAKYLGPDGNSSNKPFIEAGPPFHRCYLVNLPEPRAGSLNSVKDASGSVSQASEYLFRDLASPLGKELDARRRQPGLGLGMSYYSFGLRRLVWPRKQLLDRAARRLCKRLIDRWLSKNASSMAEEIHTWTHQNWEAQGFRVEDLIALHQDRCGKLLKQPPETLFTQIISPVAAKLTAPRAADKPEILNVGPAIEAMSELERLLGIPEEWRDKNDTNEPSLIERALTEAAAGIADNCEKKLAELVVRYLIEEPRYRLAGAEESLRQFSIIAEKGLQAHEQLAAELTERAAILYQKIQLIFESPVAPPMPTPSIWKGAFNRRASENQTPGGELLELLKAYPKCRYQSLVLEHITRLYVSLRGLLSDQLREVGYCRTRLTELQALIEQPKAEAAVGPKGRTGSEQQLLPPGCSDLDDALVALENKVSKEDLLAFDQSIQHLIQQQFQALVHVCMGPTTVIKALAPAMVHEAISYLEPRLTGNNIAQMYLDQRGFKGEVTDALKDELRNTFAEAAARPGNLSTSQETAIVALPGGEPGQQLRTVLHAALPGAYVLTTERSDEILFFREQGPLYLKDLEQCGPVSEEAYRNGVAADAAGLHTREDIPAWYKPAVEV